MAKEEQIIMVILRKKLFGVSSKEDSPQGFLSSNIYDFTPEINAYVEWMKRGSPKNYGKKLLEAESNPSYKQPIAYSVIVNMDRRKVFAFKRASEQDKYHESRLAGNWCWGVGGHVEKIDEEENKDAITIIEKSRDRELSEETTIRNHKPELAGYINDDSNEVGSVHFGFLYFIKTDNSDISPRDGEIEESGWKSLSELEEICRMAKQNSTIRVDSWSEIALEPLRKILS
ncbi:NUDIX domain-containing protein [Candidatus Pacearchaeota archaeon]|nr:NUDIX domain-containing protein [Candidatus Pacearchaeota archaeon]